MRLPFSPLTNDVGPVEVKLKRQLTAFFSTCVETQALHVVRRGAGLVECCKASGRLCSPVSSATVLSNKPALQPAAFPASRLPCRIAQYIWSERKKRSLSDNGSFTLCYHLSIRSLFCAQLGNLTEHLSFSSQRGRNDLIRSTELSTGAETNEALFFKGEHNESLWRLHPSEIAHQDFNLRHQIFWKIQIPATAQPQSL